MFAPQPGIPDWTKQALTVEEAVALTQDEAREQGFLPPINEAIKAAAQQGALITGESPEAVEEAIHMMVAKPTQPLITDDPRPRCGDEYTINRKFGEPLVVTCNKYEGHTAPGNNRISRRHWNVDHRTGWFTQKEVAGEA